MTAREAAWFAQSQWDGEIDVSHSGGSATLAIAAGARAYLIFTEPLIGRPVVEAALVVDHLVAQRLPATAYLDLDPDLELIMERTSVVSARYPINNSTGSEHEREQVLCAVRCAVSEVVATALGLAIRDTAGGVTLRRMVQHGYPSPIVVSDEPEREPRTVIIGEEA